jgi:hypothetical protein
MLAEILMLRLEMARATDEPSAAVSRFVPFNSALFTGFKVRNVRRDPARS